MAHSHGENDMDYNSDSEVNIRDHSRLVEAIGRLDKTQYIKKATRSEPTLQTSEFHLVKSGGTKDTAVLVKDLVKVLGKTAKHTEIGKKLRTTQRKVKTLEKPLEKPQAERIQRSVGFENTKKQLGRWDAVVTKNRTADYLSFPLKQPNISLQPSNVFLSKFKIKSDLEKELEALEPKQENVEENEEFPLTLEEIVERRKEASKLRAQQSYREAKARRQSKIKSKKFHRIQRREKIKQQLKDFELLQKTDPEAALQKLELLDKTRAEERASLRHRSTGQWAKNLQVRAKYDKESRQELAQQLAVSRDLTQKHHADVSSESENDAESKNIQDNKNSANPWVSQKKTTTEIADFVSGYRKYWDDRNRNADLKEKYDNLQVPEITSSIDTELPTENSQADGISKKHSDSADDANIKIMNEIEMNVINTVKNPAEKKVTAASPIRRRSNKHSSYARNEQMSTSTSLTDLNSTALSDYGRLETSLSTTKWEVTIVDTDRAQATQKSKKKNIKMIQKTPDVEELFDNLEDSMQRKASDKMSTIKLDYEIGSKDKLRLVQNSETDKDEYVSDLSFKNQKQRPDIDDGLYESNARTKPLNDEARKLETLSNLSNKIDQEVNDKRIVESIDPNKFVAMKPRHLVTALPDVVTGEHDLDDDEAVDRQMTITEAFEEDDIVADFQKEKEDEINKGKAEDIDLNLPGWGSWGGVNLTAPKNKRKRFILKFPKKVPRRDENKGDLIINENSDAKLKSHLVSELPFPFTSVRDFEASVRAPIGSTFIPETAHRRLTKPAVTTKMGAIIEPMDDDMLVNKKAKIRKIQKQNRIPVN